MEVLPLALTMMVGPQIITSIVLVTARRPITASLAYIAGIFFATLVGTLLFYFLAQLLQLRLGEPEQPSRLALMVQTGLVVILIIMAIRTYINRDQAHLPAWMSTLQDASPHTAFRTALTLIFLMPTDLITMSAVSINLASHNGSNYVRLLPFLLTTTFIAATPLLAYIMFRKRAVVAMPKVRLWMESNSWVVNIVAYGFFLFLVWPHK